MYQLLGPVVVSILQEAMSGCPASVTEITPGLLLKDAAYGAAAHVYYELSNYLSFKDWYVHCSPFYIGMCSDNVLQFFSLCSIIVTTFFVFLFLFYLSWLCCMYAISKNSNDLSLEILVNVQLSYLFSLYWRMMRNWWLGHTFKAHCSFTRR